MRACTTYRSPYVSKGVIGVYSLAIVRMRSVSPSSVHASAYLWTRCAGCVRSHTRKDIRQVERRAARTGSNDKQAVVSGCFTLAVHVNCHSQSLNDSNGVLTGI